MATGTLAQSTVSATTNTTVYTVPAGKTAIINLNLLNIGGSVLYCRVAIADADTPTNAEYIEYTTELNSYSVLERTGIVVSENKKIVVYSSNNDLVVNVYGYED